MSQQTKKKREGSSIQRNTILNRNKTINIKITDKWELYYLQVMYYLSYLDTQEGFVKVGTDTEVESGLNSDLTF